MAYAGDLKSLALRGVRVRLPPRAPITPNVYAGFTGAVEFLALGAANATLPNLCLAVVGQIPIIPFFRT
jgi:hypothetical protein